MSTRSHLEDYRQELEALLKSNLWEELFSSRAFLRPADVKSLAAAVTTAFFDFLVDCDSKKAEFHGGQLYHAGVGDVATLRIGQVLRHFCEAHRGDDESGDCVRTLDAYYWAVVLGYFRARDANILEEQERIRSALQHTLHRYTLQIETAAEVARAAISTLDLGVILTTAVDLIGERFSLDYVGIYLLDAEKRSVVLRAATGLEGRRRLAADHRLKVNGASTVSRCIVARQHVLISSPAEENAAPETSWIPGTHSEIALPLITRDVVIGALSAQSHRAASFSSQDVPGFQIMADQLASAIENARLYADARHRADDLAEAYEQLKELERLKDQFMQNVSHELRTPLTMIRGYSELLLIGQDGMENPEQREALQVILRNSEALSELVADILAIMEVSAAKSAMTPVSMHEVVLNSLANFQFVAKQNKVTLVPELQSGNGNFPITARPDHLRRIVDNLLSNAVKFTPAGGSVYVRLWQDASRVFFEVADTGIGIPAEFQNRVFERFFQVDGTKQRRFGGTGLGLALVKELVESYGGYVSAASPGPNQGSTFTVVLPLAQG